MLEIAGGILIAYLVLVTTPLWLPILLYAACIALIVIGMFFCYEYPAVPITVIAVSLYNSKTVKKVGLLKAFLLLLRKIWRKLRTKKSKISVTTQIKGIGNLALGIIYYALCSAPTLILCLLKESELFSYLMAPLMLLTCLLAYLIFIRYPSKMFIKIKQESNRQDVSSS